MTNAEGQVRAWRDAVVVSLACNVLLFGLTALLTERSSMSGRVEYLPIELIQLAGADNPVSLPPSAPAPPPDKPPVEARPQPVVEKELGLDRTGQEPVPPASEPQQTVYQPFHTVTRLPHFKTQVKPLYPQSERAADREARVIAEVYINQFGGVDGVQIIKSGGPLFDEAVIKAVTVSSFSPAYREGRPVAVKMQIPYVFKLR